jgi:hypothetical protein
LVSKLRENAKTVIGVGVKNSTSDLLISNCDEFIFYDDLIREQVRKNSTRKPAKSRSSKRSKKTATKAEDRTQEGIDLALETAAALNSERGDQEKLWGSMVKQALKRRRPGFNESYYGFDSFSKLLEEAQDRGQVDLELDERSGGYIIRKVIR